MINTQKTDKINIGNKKFIVLVGLMGSGKTSLGKALAKLVNLPFLDSDSKIENISGKTIKQLLDCVSKNGLYIIEDLHTCSYSVDTLYGFKLVQEGDTLTTHLLKDWRDSTNLIHATNYLSKDDILYIKRQIQKVYVDMCKHSEIAFIYKNNS